MHTPKKKITGSRGESMIFAVILMFLFLLMGVAVMTAASATTAGITQRTAQNQLYYASRSVLDALDESIQHGELGQALRNSLHSQLTQSAQDSLVVSCQGEDAMALNIELPQAMGDDYHVRDATLEYSGRLTVMKAAAGGMVECGIGLDDVRVTCTVEYRERSYRLWVSYTYDGWGTKYGQKWRWDDLWRVKNLGQ